MNFDGPTRGTTSPAGIGKYYHLHGHHHSSRFTFWCRISNQSCLGAVSLLLGYSRLHLVGEEQFPKRQSMCQSQRWNGHWIAIGSTNFCCPGLLGLKVFTMFKGLLMGMVVLVGWGWSDHYSGIYLEGWCTVNARSFLPPTSSPCPQPELLTPLFDVW